MFGVLTSYTDIKYKRAYNKTILAFIAIGIGIQTASVILDTTIFPHTMANFVMTVAVSLLFYALKIWAAGDAKVFIAMVLLIPLPMYMLGDEILFP
jgi:Flp pilus assembly protein protease CpaA